jgi:hypothetical protein
VLKEVSLLTIECQATLDHDNNDRSTTFKEPQTLQDLDFVASVVDMIKNPPQLSNP